MGTKLMGRVERVGVHTATERLQVDSWPLPHSSHGGDLWFSASGSGLWALVPGVQQQVLCRRMKKMRGGTEPCVRM